MVPLNQPLALFCILISFFICTHSVTPSDARRFAIYRQLDTIDIEANQLRARLNVLTHNKMKLLDELNTTYPIRRSTNKPTKLSTRQPTNPPTKRPTKQPTKKPTKRPTKRPTKQPSRNTNKPTKLSTRQPTNPPTKRPTKQPTKK
eukprot:922679_1